MDIKEDNVDGVVHEFAISVPAGDVRARFDEAVKAQAKTAKMDGFRPGKVPLAHIEKRFGAQIMRDAVDALLREAHARILEKHKLRPALEPEIRLETDPDALLRDGGDVRCRMRVEAIAAFDAADITKIELETPKAEIKDTDVAAALDNLMRQSRFTNAEEAGRGAARGDMLAIEMTAIADGKKVIDTQGETRIVLGESGLPDAFDARLEGMLKSAQVDMKIPFPPTYPNPALAGREVAFHVAVKAIYAPRALTATDAFAKEMGLESLEALRQALRAQLEAACARAAHAQTRRQIMDALNKAHDFQLPPGLVARERTAIEEQTEALRKESGAPKPPAEDLARSTQIRELAERRVRVGLVLAEIARGASLSVSGNDMAGALAAYARRFPGEEKQAQEAIIKNPGALENLRAGLLEDKVIAHIEGKAQQTHKDVSCDELLKQG